MRGGDLLGGLARELAVLGPPIVLFYAPSTPASPLLDALLAAGVHLRPASASLVALIEHCRDFVMPDLAMFEREEDPAMASLVRRAFTEQVKGMRLGDPWGWSLGDAYEVLPVLARLFPSAQLVHLVRDGRDVACDSAERGRAWAQAVAEARARGQMAGGRYREVRVEDVAADPHAALEGLVAVPRLPASPPLERPWARVDLAARGPVLAALGETLGLFGYGDDAVAPPARLSVVVLDGEDGRSDDTLADLAALAMLRPEVVQVRRGAHAGPYGTVPSGAVEVGAAAETWEMAAAGLAVARGDYTLFVRGGTRLSSHGLPRLLRQATRARAGVAAGRLACGPDGALSPLILHQDGLAHCEALPVGAVMFRTEDAVRLGVRPGRWHHDLLCRAADEDLLLLTDHRIGDQTSPCALTLLGPAPLAEGEQRFCFYGPPGTSADALTGGLPAALRDLFRFVPQGGRAFDLPHLARASAVLLVGDASRPLADGTLATLRQLGVPLWAVVDRGLAEDVRAMVRGAFAVHPALLEPLRAAVGEVYPWTPVLDARLVAADDPAELDVLRVGVMASSPAVEEALARLARRVPLRVFAPAGAVRGAGFPVSEMAPESSPRRATFLWQRQRVRVAVQADPLTSLYLGAVPVVAGEVEEASGAVSAIDGWEEGVLRAARERVPRLWRLRAWCESRFSDASARAVVEVLRRSSSPVSEARAAERLRER